MTSEEYGHAYNKGFDLTVRLLCSRGVQADHAREVAQAAWVRGWERIGQLRDKCLVTTWVNTIALNVNRGLIRKEPVRNLPELPHGTSYIDLTAIDIARVLSRCRPSHRQLLEQFMLGVTPREIAEREGVSDTAIRIRMLRARRAVRMQIERRRILPSRCR